MSLSPIGDTLALATLAHNLYSKGYLVVRDAPAEFRSLLDQLRVFRRVILQFNHKVDRDRNPLSECTGLVLEQCSQTLGDFETLLAKYERLGRVFHTCHAVNENSTNESWLYSNK